MSRMDKTQEQLKAALMAAQDGEQRTVSRTDNPRSPRPGAPRHPIRSMQGPFEESIEDATNPPDTKAQENFNKLDPRKRRQRLLDTDSTNGTYNEQWRTRASNAKFHPLTKIISQVAFGVHLLHQQLAKSDEEVVKILQKHVDDVDNFVQRAEEDLDLAISDVRERINYLKLPLEHAGVFEVMLDDKAFRTQIVVGNEKIEKVVDATTGLVKDLQVDVQKGLESTIDFGKYLDEISDNWPQNDRGSIQIFQTMQANVEGWVQCMSTLQMKGNGLSVAVVQLGSILSEMAKRAASASRREQRRAERSANGNGNSKSRSSSQHRHANRHSRSERRNSYKPLPHDPDLVARVVEATLPGAKVPHHGRSREKHYDEPRQAPKSSAGSMRSMKSGKSGKSVRDGRKPPPIHLDKMPTLRKTELEKSETTIKDKMSGFVNVFRFHGSASAAPTPLTSPGLPPPNFPESQAVSPMTTPRASSVLPPRKFFSPPAAIPQEMEAEQHTIFELDNDPQATLIEARHKLRSQQSQDFVVQRKPLQTPTTETPKSAASPRPSSAEGEDSAYASSPETEQVRPTTSPTPRPPAIGSFGIFPSASMTSLPSMAAAEQDRQSDKMSITSPSVTALPIISSPTLDATANITSTTPKDPSRLRHGSEPAALPPPLKKRTSFSALKKFFQRRSASADPTSRIQMVSEEDEKGANKKKDKENQMPPVLERSLVPDHPVELPA